MRFSANLLVSTSLAFFCFKSAYAQSAKIEHDTVYYNNTKLYTGKDVQLLYGSGLNKNYAFVTVGSRWGGMELATADLAKQTVKIDKVYQSHNKCYVRGKIGGVTRGVNSVFIDVEGAIDNKEINEK